MKQPNQEEQIVIDRLNEIEVPDHDHPENDGRVPWAWINEYGEWLFQNDPIAFQVYFNEQNLNK